MTKPRTSPPPAGPQLDAMEYAGWPNCLRFTTDDLRLIITLDVGPRVIACHCGDGPNLFKEFDDQLGVTQGDEWMPFGGHRLWHAPEVYPRTYAPDFDPVTHHWDGTTLDLIQPTEPTTGIQKQISISSPEPGHLELTHRLTNHNVWPVPVSPWCLTQMAPNGRAIVPQEDYRPHPEHLYPARPLVLWHFTKMNDPRVHWGERFIQLDEREQVDQKIKFGAFNKQQWAAYWLAEYLFVKTFDAIEFATYPDCGSNCEFFTMPGFLELESLGPLTTMAPGEQIDHRECWHVQPCSALPEDEAGLGEALAPILKRLYYPDDSEQHQRKTQAP